MTPVLRAKTLSVSVERRPGEVYGFVSDPRNLPGWVGSFYRSVRESGSGWVAETPLGSAKVRFVAGGNGFGVLDHYVTLPSGQEIFNPMRVVPNGDGSEVIFTLFRLPGMSDDGYAEDLASVERDLKNLKDVLEERS